MAGLPWELIAKILGGLVLILGIFAPNFVNLVKAAKALLDTLKEAWEDNTVTQEEWAQIAQGAINVFIASLPIWVSSKYKERLGTFKLNK